MTDVEKLRDILRDSSEQLRAPRPDIIHREQAASLEERKKYEVIEVITGVRRSGKSTVLLDMGKSFIEKGVNVHYINFEDERFIPVVEDLQNILTIIGTDEAVLLLDEPQIMPRWEKWVRRLHDRGIKVYLTGSNSSLLGSELASALSGRNRTHEVFPFSFEEFLSVKNSGSLTSDKLVRMLDVYIEEGGFPYPTISGDKILSDYRRDILERDILLRHRMTDPERFKRLVRFVLSNPGVLLSKKRMGGLLDIHHSTLRKYVGYMEDAYLIITLEKFGRSQRVQMQNPKKVYPMDNGLLLDKSGRGLLLEAAVVQHLRRFYSRIYYWKDENGREVDIYIPEIDTAIQVAYDINKKNIRREEAALDSAERELGCNGIIVYLYSNVETRHRRISAVELLLNTPEKVICPQN